MKPSHPPGPGASRAELLEASPHHREFLRLTERNRGLQFSRELLRSEWKYLGPLLNGRASGRVLDLACGTGTMSVAWAERGGRVVGMDLDRGLLGLAREFLARAASEAGRGERIPRPQWVCGDGCGLPFPDGLFDVVFCNSLLEHVPDWRGVLDEIGRVLAPGGVAVVFTTNRHCPIQQEVNHFPFYSWLPDVVKRRVLRWIMANRRDLVNYTDFPAVNWFTFPGMRRAFRARGLDPYDRIDLAPPGGLNGLKASVTRLMQAVPPLKLAYYLGTSALSLYGVKRRS